MNIDDLRQFIEIKTGVPASLLTGETAEENIAQARAYLAIKRKNELESKPTRQQFAEWFAGEGGEPKENPLDALEDIATANNYPTVKDGGETGTPDTRTTKEQFSDWFNKKSAWNPLKDPDGWENIF